MKLHSQKVIYALNNGWKMTFPLNMFFFGGGWDMLIFGKLSNYSHCNTMCNEGWNRFDSKMSNCKRIPGKKR